MPGPYPYSGVIILDQTTGLGAVGATGHLYAFSDTGRATPLPVLDPYGTDLDTILTAGGGGLTPDFTQADHRVAWFKSGDPGDLTLPSFLLWSPDGIDADAAAALLAAQEGLNYIAQWVADNPGGGGGGVVDHGALNGLAADDHPQYLNQERADIRYYTRLLTINLVQQAINTNSEIDRDLANAYGLLDAALIDGLTTAMVTDLPGLLTGKQPASPYIPYFYELGEGEINPPSDFPDGGWVFEGV